MIKPVAKSTLIKLGWIAAASASDAGIHKKIWGSGRRLSSTSRTTTLITSNDEMKDIVKIVKSLEDSGLLLKGVSETIQNEDKEQKTGFLNMLWGTLGESLLGIVLAIKGINRAGERATVKRQGQGVITEKTTKLIFNVASSID